MYEGTLACLKVASVKYTGCSKIKCKYFIVQVKIRQKVPNNMYSKMYARVCILIWDTENKTKIKKKYISKKDLLLFITDIKYKNG